MNAPAAVLSTATAQQLDRRRVFIFPSRAGFTLALMLLIILLGAINYDNALGYLLAFLLGGMFLVVMLHTYRNLVGLRFIGARASPVFVGETALFDCLIDNPAPRSRLALVLKRWPGDTSRQQRRYLRRFETQFSIDANSNAAAAVAVPAERRGRLALERIALDTVYPLGILRAWAYFDSNATCLVYPYPRGTLPLPFGAVAASGNAVSTTSGADEFAGMQRYRPGDPVRAIAWKTLAKAQNLMVKRFHGQAATELMLNWSALGTVAGLEARLSQLTAWVLEAERRGLRYGIDIPGTHIGCERGGQHRDRILAVLALYREPT